MTVPAVVGSAPLEVLAAGGDGVFVAAHGGDLYISGDKLAVKRVCGAAVAVADRSFVAAFTLDKEVVVLSRQTDDDPWREVAKHLLPKRPTAASFSLQTEQLIVADAFGDVYMLPVGSSVNLRGDGNQGTLLLGHFSTVTALALSGSMIATADRDNKLRVSRFPNSYVIESFCLAHEEFITCLRWIGTDRLISGAGDGTLRLWNAADGRLVETVQIRDHVPGKKTDVSDVKECPVVICIEPFPDNHDNAVVGVYRANFALVVTGLRSNTLRVHTTLMFKESDSMTGMAFDEKNRLWVSLDSDCHSVRTYSLPDLEKSEPKLEVQGSMQLRCNGLTESNDASAGTCGGATRVTRFDWLNQQRKREMVEDWKGKKRKHIEI